MRFAFSPGKTPRASHSGTGGGSLRNALVPIVPAACEREALRTTGRANADFIAHLIATATQAPQTRLRRRVEPEQATAAYRALGHWPTAIGRSVRRSL